MYKQGLKQARKHVIEESRGNETLSSRAGLRDSSKDFLWVDAGSGDII